MSYEDVDELETHVRNACGEIAFAIHILGEQHPYANGDTNGRFEFDGYTFQVKVMAYDAGPLVIWPEDMFNGGNYYALVISLDKREQYDAGWATIQTIAKRGGWGCLHGQLGWMLGQEHLSPMETCPPLVGKLHRKRFRGGEVKQNGHQ